MSTLEIIVGLGFAALLAFVAVYTARLPLRTLRRLQSNEILPSDDRAYLRKQARRRLLNSAFMLVLGGFLSWTYLSGMERQAGELARKVHESQKLDREIPDQEKEADWVFLRQYVIRWVCILVMVFLIMCLALLDLLATRKYAWQQLMLLKDDHKAKLERDLALYRQQMNDRRRGLNE